MKVAYVFMQFPVASEAFAAVELRALRRQGAEVAVLAYRRPPPDAQALLAERGLADLTVFQGGGAALLEGLWQMLLHPVDSLALISEILRHCWRRPLQLCKALALVPRSFSLLHRLETLKPDVLHLFWGHYPSLLGLLARRRLPRTVISLFLGAYDLEEAFPLSARLARAADLVVTHARANLPALKALGLNPAGVEVCYRGIDIAKPPPAPQKTRGLIVVAERLVPQKRTADALAVFARVAAAVPEARLLVLGAGPEQERLQGLAAQLGIDVKVTFAGHLPQTDVFRRLAAAEVALTMSRSRSERLPNALKEAMLQRCLCLATRSTGIEELISDGETGLLVDFEAIEDAARRLIDVLRDPAAVDRIGRHAQAHVLAHFDVDHLMAGRLQRWSSLCRIRAEEKAA